MIDNIYFFLLTKACEETSSELLTEQAMMAEECFFSNDWPIRIQNNSCNENVNMDVFDSPTKEAPAAFASSTSAFTAGEDSLIQFMKSNLPTNDLPSNPAIESMAHQSSTAMTSIAFSPGNDFNSYDMSKLVGAHDDVSFSRVMRQMNGDDGVSFIAAGQTDANAHTQKPPKSLSTKPTPRFSSEDLQKSSLFSDTVSNPNRVKATSTPASSLSSSSASAAIATSKRQKKRIIPERVDSLESSHASASKQPKLSTDGLGISEQDLCFMDETNFTNFSNVILEYKKSVTSTAPAEMGIPPSPAAAAFTLDGPILPNPTAMAAPQPTTVASSSKHHQSLAIVDKVHSKPPRPTRASQPGKTGTRSSRPGLYSPIRSILIPPGLEQLDHATLSLLNVDDLLLDCPDINMTNISFAATNTTNNGNHNSPYPTTTSKLDQGHSRLKVSGQKSAGNMNNNEVSRRNDSSSSLHSSRGKQRAKGGNSDSGGSSSSSSSSNAKSEGLFGRVMAKVPPTKR